MLREPRKDVLMNNFIGDKSVAKSLQLIFCGKQNRARLSLVQRRWIKQAQKVVSSRLSLLIHHTNGIFLSTLERHILLGLQHACY